MKNSFCMAVCATLLASTHVHAATLTTGDGQVLPANGENGGRIDAGRNGTGEVTIDGVVPSPLPVDRRRMN
jgi:hypothetical protein